MYQHVNEVLNLPSTTVSGTARMVLIVLAHWADEHGNVYKTRSQIAEACGIKNSRHLDPHIKTLVMHRLISRDAPAKCTSIHISTPTITPTPLESQLIGAGVNPKTAKQIAQQYPEEQIRHGLQFKDKGAAYIITCIRNPIQKAVTTPPQTPSPPQTQRPRVPDSRELDIEALRLGLIPTHQMLQQMKLGIADAHEIHKQNPNRIAALVQACAILDEALVPVLT